MKLILPFLLLVGVAASAPPMPPKITAPKASLSRVLLSPRAAEQKASLGTPMALSSKVSLSTNRPPPIPPFSMAWDVVTTNWSNFILRIAHSSGMPYTDLTIPTNAVNLTNFNTRAAWVFRIREVEKTGFMTYFGPELWINVKTNGTVWITNGWFNLAFPIQSNTTYQVVSPPGSTNVLLNVNKSSNAVILFREQLNQTTKQYQLIRP